jgi:cold shock CspA family protein/ribosome-associated translation inhibitor RaiA
MQVPLEISYRDVPKTDGLEALIRERAAKLERICSHMTSCRVAVEKNHEHQNTGNPYRVRIHMTVPPGHELVAKRESTRGNMHDSLFAVVRKAFRAAEKQLRSLDKKQEGQLKSHPNQQMMGIVANLFPDQGYGFIKRLEDQQDIYFHRNSVLHKDFQRIQVGTGVRFVVEEGEKGPQATTVEIVDKPASA